MKIAFDIRRIADFGVGTYIRNVVRTLARLDSANRYLLLGQDAHFRALGGLPDNFSHLPYALSESSPRNLWEFSTTLRRAGCDLVHVPHLVGMPQRFPCRYVVTVHDLLAYVASAQGGSGWRRALNLRLTRRLLRRASRVLAVSNFTKNEIARYFEIAAEKIEVVHNAIDERFQRGHASDADRRFIAERYQVQHPFLLYAGNIKPHKNVVRIIEAFSALKGELAKEEKFQDLKLIIIGDELSQHPDLRRTVIRSGVQNDVRFLGFVPIEVLRIFYDAAKIFVFPSLYEGFGLPPLEAMAHGTPVVTSNSSSLPEVVGNAAVLVNPENVFEIRNALQRVLLDQELRERLKQRGYEQAQRYSWELSARRILQVYEEVGQKKPARAAAA
jgi:glycosyltransferase involved in cell wall biosynthesis